MRTFLLKYKNLIKRKALHIFTNLAVIKLIVLFVLVFDSNGINTSLDGTLNYSDKLPTLNDYLTTASAFGLSGSIIIAKEGKIILHEGYGMSNRENSIPNTKDTVFDIGSITKQFTAAAILKLEMQGRLSTNDPINKYLANVPSDKSNISLHHLLTHSSGLVNYSGKDYDAARRDETVNRILTTTLLSEPGKKFAYSNAGYTLLAAIIEHVSGEPYEVFLQQNLFHPARMRKTGYKQGEWEKSILSYGYAEGKNQGTPLDHPWDISGPYWNLFGNGGMLSTTEDLYNWSQALKGEHILSAAAKQKLFTPFLQNYAYGWRIEDTPFGKLINHGGASSTGFIANFHIYPEKDTVIIILTNSIPAADFFFSRRLLDRFTSNIFGNPLPVFPIVNDYKVVPEQLKRYEGVYILPTGERFIIKTQERLSIEAEGQKAINLLAFHEESDLKNFSNLNLRAEQIIKAVLQNEYQPLNIELGNQRAIEQWKNVLEKWQKEWKDEGGSFESFEILGTVPNWWDDGKLNATSIRVRLEKTSKIFQLFWRENKLHSLSRNRSENPITTPFIQQSENDFVGYHLELANPVRIRFNTSKDGTVNELIIFKKNEVITAQRLR